MLFDSRFARLQAVRRKGNNIFPAGGECPLTKDWQQRTLKITENIFAEQIHEFLTTCALGVQP